MGSRETVGVVRDSEKARRDTRSLGAKKDYLNAVVNHF